MKRIAGAISAVLIGFLLVVPAVSALSAQPLPHSGRVILAFNGDVTVPTGEQADAVVVVNGKATILGTVNTVMAFDASIEMTGARAESIVAVRSPVTLGAGTVISGDVRTLDSPVHKIGNADVQGNQSDLQGDLVGLGAILGPALFLLWVGFALAAVVAGLLLAALASRQVRAAEALMRHEPGTTLLAGLAGLIVTPIVAVLLIITVIGAPLGVGILIGLWPLTAFVGYLVAGIWIGDLILGASAPLVTRERPYLAAVIGIVLLELAAVLPPLIALASLFGFGSVVLLAWRTFRSHGLGVTQPSRPVSSAPAATPMAG